MGNATTFSDQQICDIECTLFETPYGFYIFKLSKMSMYHFLVLKVIIRTFFYGYIQMGPLCYSKPKFDVISYLYMWHLTPC